ncbi:MAG: hypothetical protein EBU46_21385, partial [Nitrosomonadaceae bacterium]|nr:hypothetical protein [Nitrosomonadaceae bacterium]
MSPVDPNIPPVSTCVAVAGGSENVPRGGVVPVIGVRNTDPEYSVLPELQESGGTVTGVANFVAELLPSYTIPMHAELASHSCIAVLRSVMQNPADMSAHVITLSLGYAPSACD